MNKLSYYCNMDTVKLQFVSRNSDKLRVTPDYPLWPGQVPGSHPGCIYDIPPAY